jgi:hypothetical protein
MVIPDQLLRIGTVAAQYMRQPVFPNDVNFKEWIESLQEPMKSAFKEKGIEGCKGVLNYRRFLLELEDNGMDEFMKSKLGAEDFDFWVQSKSR